MIHQLMGSVAAACGAEEYDNVLGLPAAKRYVVMLVDGMGAQLLAEHAHQARWLSSQESLGPVQCTMPSTTSASMTSLGTGLQPGQHGMVGYAVRIPGTTDVLNTLKWDAPIDPVSWQPHAPILSTLSDTSIAATVVTEERFVGSGLTACSQRGVPLVAVTNAWQRLEAVCDAVEDSDRAIVQAYESELDHVGHSAGCRSAQWREQLAKIDSDLAMLRAELPADTMLLVTADHGMVDIAPDRRVDVDRYEALTRDVTVLAGEARLRHVFTRSGAEAEVAARWQEHFGDQVEVRLRDETEEWFGPIAPRVAERIGDVVVAATGDVAMMSSERFPVELTLEGFHGGLSDVERNIPLIVAG